MTPAPLKPIAPAAGENAPAPDLGRLDFLGRMPIPLRRPFKAGLDRTVAAHQAATGTRLECCFLGGGEWYRRSEEHTSELQSH